MSRYLIPYYAIVKHQREMNHPEITKKASKNLIGLVLACACAGLVIGVTTLTGVGLKFSTLFVQFSGGNLLIALILAMITSIILGMGLPTVAAYIMLATLGAPALVNLGVEPIAAHLFIFYFGIISAVTPPVALAAYAAAGIAESNQFETAISALKIALAAFIIPYMFIYGPSLLFIGSISKIVISSITALLGVTCLAGFTMGYFIDNTPIWQRLLLLAASLMLIYPGFYTDGGGIVLLAIISIIQLRNKKQKERLTKVGENLEG